MEQMVQARHKKQTCHASTSSATGSVFMRRCWLFLGQCVVPVQVYLRGIRVSECTSYTDVAEAAQRISIVQLIQRKEKEEKENFGIIGGSLLCVGGHWPPAIAQLHNVKKEKYKYWKVVQGHTNTQKIRRKLLHLPLSLSLH